MRPAFAAIRTTAAAGSRLLSGRRAFLVSGFWTLVLRVGGLASGFALGVVLARVLGPAEFGIYGLVTTAAAVIMTIAQVGTPQLAVRELSGRAAREDWPSVRRLLRDFFRVVVLVGCAMGAVAVVAALVLHSSRDHLLYIVEGAALATLMALTALFGAELRGLGALLKGQVMDIALRPALAFLIVGGLLLTSGRISGHLALWVQIGVAVFAAIVSAAWISGSIPAAGRTPPVAPHIPWLKSAVPLGMVDLLRQLDGSYGVVLVGWLSTAVDLGVFRVAVACAVVAAMPVTIFHVLLAPTISRLFQAGEHAELQRLLTWTSRAMLAIMLPASAAAWFAGKFLVGLVFGLPYQDAWLPLFVLTLVQLTYAVFGMGPILLAMCDSERDLIRIYAIAIGCALLAAIPMTMAWGGTGAAAGPVISAMLIGLLSRRFARRQLGLEITALRWSGSPAA